MTHPRPSTARVQAPSARRPATPTRKPVTAATRALAPRPRASSESQDDAAEFVAFIDSALDSLSRVSHPLSAEIEELLVTAKRIFLTLDPDTADAPEPDTREEARRGQAGKMRHHPQHQAMLDNMARAALTPDQRREHDISRGMAALRGGAK